MERFCSIPRGMDNYWFKFCEKLQPPKECDDCPEHIRNKKPKKENKNGTKEI